jgi:NAD(P)H-binding
MSEPILVTGAAGGSQGSTGRRITSLLLEKGIPVRAFVHKLDARSDALRELGAEVVQGDLLDRDSVRASLTGIKRAYFTYSVSDGLLEATTIFAMAAREAGPSSSSTIRNFRARAKRRAFAICNMDSRITSSIGRKLERLEYAHELGVPLLATSIVNQLYAR